jgi:hypothetical protein
MIGTMLAGPVSFPMVLTGDDKTSAFDHNPTISIQFVVNADIQFGRDIALGITWSHTDGGGARLLTA